MSYGVIGGFFSDCNRSGFGHSIEITVIREIRVVGGGGSCKDGWVNTLCTLCYHCGDKFLSLCKIYTFIKENSF